MSLNRGLAMVVLKPQNHFSLDALKGRVRDSGFTAGSLEITAAGEVIRCQNRPAFQVGGRNDLVFLLALTARDRGPSIETVGTRVIVTGTVMESGKRTEPATLQVTKIETPKT